MAPEAGPAGRRLTWAGLGPDEHAERVAARARENVTKIPAEHRESPQRYRLRVVDDDVDSEAAWAFEGSWFATPEAAVEHLREDYRGEWAHGLYEIEPVFSRGGRERAVPFGEPPINGDEALYAVGYVRDYRDPTSGHWCAETVAVTGYVERGRAEKLLAKTKAGDPDFDGYLLLPDRDEHEDVDEEPPDDDGDPLDDGTIGYDYYGPSWATRDI